MRCLSLYVETAHFDPKYNKTTPGYVGSEPFRSLEGISVDRSNYF